MEMLSMLLMLIVLGLFTPSSQAVTCHSCNSVTSSDCGDPFQTSGTCNGDVCAKAKYEVHGQLAIYLLLFMLSFDMFISTNQ